MPKARVKADIHDALGGGGGGGIVVIGGATVSSTQLQDLALNSILLLKQGVAAPLVFDLGSAGFAAALAAAESRDVIWTGAGTIGGDHTIPEHVTVASMPFSRTAFTGCLTLSDGAVLNGLELYRVADQAGDLVCLVPPSGAGEMAYCGYCWIVANNANGDGYAVYGACDHLTLRDCYVSAQSGGVDSNPFGAGSGGGWPATVYAATKTLGIYTTDDTLDPGEAQPAWSTLNTGLSNTDIISFCLDRHETVQDSRMFCIDATTATLWRRTTGDWAAVLTTADAKTEAGAEDNETLQSVIVDEITGYVYALLSKASDSSLLAVLRSTDHGDSWTSSTVWTKLYLNGIGNVDAYNGVVALSWVPNIAIALNTSYSTDHGQTWSHVQLGTSGAYSPGVRINRASGTVWYGNHGSGYGLYRGSSAGSITALQGGNAYGPYSTGGGVWCDPSDVNHVITAPGAIWVVTTDAFATVDSDDATSVSDATEIADVCEDGYWVHGCYQLGGPKAPVHVSTDGITMTARSGTNWNSSPYTDAIPVTCGGITPRGLWLVASTDLAATPYVEGCIIGNESGRLLAIPEWGDRSAWDVAHYGVRHASDWATGDSHHPPVTLGAGSAEELTLDGQELTLAAVLTPTEHTAIGDAAPHHARAHTLDSETDHTDVENSAKADGYVLVWRSGAGKHVYEDVVGSPSNGNYAATAGYAESIGDGVETVYTVTHSLNTWDVIVQIYDTDASPTEQVAATVELASADAITVTFEEIPAADQYRVLVLAVNVGINNTVVVEEEDSDPSVTDVDTIKFPNGSLTDNLDGSVSVAFTAPDAGVVTYTPAVVTDWDSDADPGNADDALDQLAERVDDIEGAALADHAHAGVAGDGGTFDAANLTAGASTDGQVLTSDGAGGAAWEDASGGGDVATDAIWDTKGDLAVGTGANTASKLAAGTNGHILYADSGEATGLKWAAPPAGGAVDAADVTYTPAVAADWDGDADPGDADEALDQLAERVDDLEGAGGGGNATYDSAYASPPASPNEGDLWLPTDSYYTFRYDGAAWVPYHQGRPMVLPVDGDFAWVNETGVTKTTDGGTITLAFTTAGADNLRLRAKAAPSTPYTITAALLQNGPTESWAVGYLGWRQSSDGKLALIVFGADRIAGINYNSPTSYAAWLTSRGQMGLLPLIWYRITDDGTNRIMSYSLDGYHFYILDTRGRTDFMTADQVCWGGQGGGYASMVTLFSWEES